MELIPATKAFATLGHPGRLAVLRLLMRFAPQGVRPTEIAAALGLKPNTLSHHLADLAQAGLVQVTRRGRSLYYAADLETAEGLIGYLALDLGRARPDLLPAPAPPRRDEAAQPGPGFNVLFLCSGNSARSIMAEALLRDRAGAFNAFSAGTRIDSGARPNPAALVLLERRGHSTAGLRSKHLSAYRQPDAPTMDLVVTVCDTAAAEECPPWPGQPITGHWGLPDPVQAPEADKPRAFARTYDALRQRIDAFAALPVESLSRLALQRRIDAISALPPPPL